MMVDSGLLPVELNAGAARALVLPRMGAGLACLECGGLPVLRPWNGHIADGPFALAMILLAPFSNRIRDGFNFDGRFHAVKPNMTGERFPIHGDAFQRAWDIVDVTDSRVRLNLDHGEILPFRYSASVTYELTPQSMRVSLDIKNSAGVTLPYGCGFHPWFPRSTRTRLGFAATHYWPEGAWHMRADESPVAVPEALRFNEPSPLPDEWINAGFSGWNGKATILQGSDALSCTIETRNADHAILHSPSADADFFCFEPVSHPVDAHNLPFQDGLVDLVPGASTRIGLDLKFENNAEVRLSGISTYGTELRV